MIRFLVRRLLNYVILCFLAVLFTYVLASLTFNTPRVAHDLASIPMSRPSQAAIASSVLGSQLPPYEG